MHDYLTAWFNEQFSGNFGEECARIYEGYAQITNVCKVEHLTRDVFSQTAYGDEAGRRVQRLQELYTRVCRVHDALPAAERDAFFELLGMKVSASYFINAAFYYADRSRLSCRQGKTQCADEYARLSRLLMGCKRPAFALLQRDHGKRQVEGHFDARSLSSARILSLYGRKARALHWGNADGRHRMERGAGERFALPHVR